MTVSAEKLNTYIPKQEVQKPNIPNGMWVKCDKCSQIIYTKDLRKNNHVCVFCKHHFRLSAKERIEQVIDDNTWIELDKDIISGNPLSFKGYEKKIKDLECKTGIKEAVVTGIGEIKGEKIVLCVMDSNFFMGSMGSVVGEKITRAIEKATEEELPIIIFTASGGARMQEGMYSLMQMAKISSALSKLNERGLLYISVLTDPTTGGVTASFAMLGDLILSEPGALVGFAGKRVIEQTIKQKLPEEFQSAEFLLDHGFIDKIVPRKDMKHILANIIAIHRRKPPNISLNKFENKDSVGLNHIKHKVLEPWDKVNMVRKIERPTALDYIDSIFDNFIQLHGDRYFGDDKCVVGGVGFLNGKPVTVIGQQKGRDLKENIYRNFGMPNPEGYRKALRLMKQAEKFNRPIVCFVDTPGAFCGIGAEERGQGEAIAKNLISMASLKTPIVSIVIGEGGSGGALALTVADEICMLENAVYSILSPEGFASILWKDATKAKEACSIMKITAEDLKEFSIIDKVIKEPYGDASKDKITMSSIIKSNLVTSINELLKLNMDDLLNKRYNKYREIGKYIEG
nr:acetyl-CoA carboxylase carboxyltransferase subunit alpha [Clostridium rectalis]